MCSGVALHDARSYRLQIFVEAVLLEKKLKKCFEFDSESSIKFRS